MLTAFTKVLFVSLALSTPFLTSACVTDSGCSGELVNKRCYVIGLGDEKCQKPLSSGATCTGYEPSASFYNSQNPCADGYHCDASSKCVTKLSIGTLCTKNGQCATNYCSSSQSSCQPEPCFSDSSCSGSDKCFKIVGGTGKTCQALVSLNGMCHKELIIKSSSFFIDKPCATGHYCASAFYSTAYGQCKVKKDEDEACDNDAECKSDSCLSYKCYDAVASYTAAAAAVGAAFTGIIVASVIGSILCICCCIGIIYMMTKSNDTTVVVTQAPPPQQQPMYTQPMYTQPTQPAYAQPQQPMYGGQQQMMQGQQTQMMQGQQQQQMMYAQPAMQAQPVLQAQVVQ